MGKDPFVRGFVKKDFQLDGLQIGESVPEVLAVVMLGGSEMPLRIEKRRAGATQPIRVYRWRLSAIFEADSGGFWAPVDKS